jgi:hypothetical protein
MPKSNVDVSAARDHAAAGGFADRAATKHAPISTAAHPVRHQERLPLVIA